MLSYLPLKAGILSALIVLVTGVALTLACAPSLPSQPPPDTGTASTPVTQTSSIAPTVQQNPAPQANTADNATAAITGQVSPVQIKLIHYRGTLTRIGCCNPGFYERDEFVVIQNIGETYVDIVDWRLTNFTRGYPTFIFPSHFPCVPYELPPPDLTGGMVSAESYYTLSKNPAQSELYRFSTNPQQAKPANIPNSEVNWAACTPLEPLDETPMQPVASEQGVPPRCILYPGQTILVFTDEIHCQTGGFSFNWGLGNIWNNVVPDTAVLYNAQGEEVSRRSYFVGR
jgi:hypothetical protein